ncbi:MAG: sulfurtransferase [Propionibacteriaceae bacterium]
MSILVNAATVAQLLAGDNPPVVIDTRWELTAPGAPSCFPKMQQEFRQGHIPGAQLIDLEGALTNHGAVGQGRHPLPTRTQLTAEFQRVGVSPQRSVVVYDAGNSMAAARVWWLLTDAGLRDVVVLNGGIAAWDGELETGDPQPVPASDWVPEPGHRGRMSADEVEAAIASGHRAIDVRAGERYRGEVEPLDPTPGHIPGAESIPAGELQHADGRYKTSAEIKDRVGELGTGDVVYCGSGITAANFLLALESAGIDGAVIYPGSYSEWSRAGRPIATGN